MVTRRGKDAGTRGRGDTEKKEQREAGTRRGGDTETRGREEAEIGHSASPSPLLGVFPGYSRPGVVGELRAFAAIVRRDWRIFRRYPSWILALLVWPFLFPVGYIFQGRALAGPDGSGLAVFSRAAGTQDFLGFIVVGTTVWMWQNIVLWRVGTALREDQLRGTLETNWLTPTWRFSFLLGSSITQLFTMMIFLVVSVLEFRLVFGIQFSANPLPALLMILAAIPAIYGMGFAFASLVIAAKEANAFVFLARGLVMIFCGITFPVALLPGWMQTATHWLPQTYIIHGLREALLYEPAGSAWPALAPDLRALLAFGAGWLLAGYLLFNWMERRARRTGALGQY